MINSYYTYIITLPGGINKDVDASGHFVSKWGGAATAVTARSSAG